MNVDPEPPSVAGHEQWTPPLSSLAGEQAAPTQPPSITISSPEPPVPIFDDLMSEAEPILGVRSKRFPRTSGPFAEEGMAQVIRYPNSSLSVS